MSSVLSKLVLILAILLVFKEGRSHNWALISNFIQQGYGQCMSLEQCHVQRGSGGKEKQEVGKMILRMVSRTVKASRPKSLAGHGCLGFLLSLPVPRQQTISESTVENSYKAP